LDDRAQSEALRIYGYNEDHGTILTSEAVIAQINLLLQQKRILTPQLATPSP